MKITTVSSSKLSTLDLKNIKFGSTFTDHMFVCDYIDGKWQTPEILPYAPISFQPSIKAFHYGQAIYEGMKAYKDAEDSVWLFRPEDNQKRLNTSAVRMAMPEFPKDIFFKGLTELVKLDKNWISKEKGSALYIRPFMIATEPTLAAAISNNYKFMIIAAPVNAYYSGAIKVLFADAYSRAADGGVGYAKTAGNYAAQFYPTDLAQKEGYQQIIWTDSNEHKYIEEAGTMNIFVRINDTLITAPVSDRILNGVTRRSIIQLALDNNITVEERRITVTEITEAAKNNSLKEIFGSGTAAVITPISGFKHKTFTHDLPEITNSYSKRFKEQLLGIQYNEIEDKHNWRFKVV